MEDQQEYDAGWLRARAEHVTHLASALSDRAARDALFALAEEYRRRAGELELQFSAQGHSNWPSAPLRW